MAVKVKHIRRKSQAELNQVPVKDGQLLYNSVSGQTFIDIGNKRITNSPIAIFAPDAGNTAKQNSELLQKLIDEASAKKGCTIYIPAGTYEFASNGQAREIDYCIRMKSDVRIVGDGETTILKPTGNTQKGLDMFYFNDYREKGQANYLSNCIFENFKIDATNTHAAEYTTAGKGFMLNLIKNCHWNNIVVINTDGTGIGVDCPIDCSVTNCVVTGCGKACPDSWLNGASGIGIGYGYSDSENMNISNCNATNNKNWGIFFEHQRRFGASASLYKATASRGFIVSDCTASGNHQNFGAEQGINVSYIHCYSQKAKEHGFVIRNSELCSLIGCTSNNDTSASFALISSGVDGGTQATKDNFITSCISKYSNYGIKIVRFDQDVTAEFTRNCVNGCFFSADKIKSVQTIGTFNKFSLVGNTVFGAVNDFTATISEYVDKGNSWNT